MSIVSIGIAGVAAAVVARARANGTPWSDIAAFPSQVVQYVIIGGPFDRTVSAHIGERISGETPPNRIWRALHKAVDTIARPWEPDHCIRSAERGMTNGHKHTNSQ